MYYFSLIVTIVLRLLSPWSPLSAGLSQKRATPFGSGLVQCERRFNLWVFTVVCRQILQTSKALRASQSESYFCSGKSSLFSDVVSIMFHEVRSESNMNMFYFRNVNVVVTLGVKRYMVVNVWHETITFDAGSV